MTQKYSGEHLEMDVQKQNIEFLEVTDASSNEAQAICFEDLSAEETRIFEKKCKYDRMRCL